MPKLPETDDMPDPFAEKQEDKNDSSKSDTEQAESIQPSESAETSVQQTTSDKNKVTLNIKIQKALGEEKSNTLPVSETVAGTNTVDTAEDTEKSFSKPNASSTEINIADKPLHTKENTINQNEKSTPGWLRKLATLAVFILICAAVSGLGGLATTPNLDWYQTLEKPFFQPPPSAFPIVWTTLYGMIAIAGWRAFEKSSGWRRIFAMGIYGAQLAVNLSWSWVFFNNKDILGGFFVIMVLLTLILATIRTFRPIDKWAAWLMWPYVAWVGFACLLNGMIVLLNTSFT
jgi:benzodiazapine receptor